MTAVVRLALCAALAARLPAHAQQSSGSHSSSAVLAQLPDGETKRQFIIDCTNCHQMVHGSNAPSGKALLR
jgi:hypothetical protein